MARPVKQLSVTPETRKKWLQRHEESGESPPQIARKEGYDVRTVRRQLDLARQEGETRETRLSVLRQATQDHYGDLCKRATDIETVLDSRGAGIIDTSDRMGVALRQHLQRAKLWKYVDQWNELQETIKQVRAGIKIVLEKKIRSDQKLNDAFSGGKMDVDVMDDVMVHQLSMRNLSVDLNFRMEPAEDGQVVYRYGAWGIGTGKATQGDKIKSAIVGFEKKISAMPERQSLTENLTKLYSLKKDLQEELFTIIYRRVVPGHCKYCPI